MAKSLFKLNPNPTFKFNVEIPVAGQDDPGVITMTFRHVKIGDHRKRLNELSEIMTTADTDPHDVMAGHLFELITAWALPDELNVENLNTLIQNYPQAYTSILQQYVDELMSVRRKN